MRYLSVLLVLYFVCSSAHAVDYPIVCVRVDRPDDTTFVPYPDVFHAVAHPPSDLILRQPDGTVTTLVSGNGTDAIFDPSPSLDGKWVYYVRIANTLKRSNNAGGPYGAPGPANIYRVEVTTGKTVRVTDNKRDLPESAGNWAEFAGTYEPGKLYSLMGVYNLGPCPLPGGKLAFVSSRNGYAPPKGYAFPNTRLFILDDIPGETDEDGEANRNVGCTGFLNVGSALHPVLLTTGEIIWSSHESQGLRDKRLWSLWRSYPDGRHWGPVYSDFSGAAAWHFHGQRSDGSLFSTLYYNFNDAATGAIFASPLTVDSPEYLSPNAAENPRIRMGWYGLGVKQTDFYGQFATMRRGLFTVTPWSMQFDNANGYVDASGTFVPQPKVTHPSGAPHNDLVLAITPGPANNLKRPIDKPVYQFQIGVIHKAVADTTQDVELLLSDPTQNYTQPKALVPYEQIYGFTPPEIPVTPNPTATPFGVVGSSSAHIGQWKPANANNPKQGFWTGAPGDETAGGTTPAGLDIVALEPHIGYAYPPANNMDANWSNPIDERCRLLARVLFNESDRPKGDTSWAVKIPADVPFTFRTFDASGRTITFAQTWHQVRPGETRTDCGGCHNHSGPEVKFDLSYYANKTPDDYRETMQRTPEFNRDVLPILKEKCWQCHGAETTLGVKLDTFANIQAYVQPGQAYASRLSKAIHGEGVTQRMPLNADPLTAEEIHAIDEWVDYFCLNEDGVTVDMTPPTLYVPREGELNVGAVDYFGLSGEPQVLLNGQPVIVTAAGDQVWGSGKTLSAGDKVLVTAKDKSGNTATVERFVRDITPVDELAQLKAQVAILQQQLQMLQADSQAKQVQIDSLTKQIQTLQTKITNARAALE